MFQENCYIVSDETGECVVIDCGAFYQEEKDAIVSYIKDNNLKPVHLLCTHGHIDHNFGNNALSAELNMQPEMHNADTPLYERLKEQASILCGVDLKEDRARIMEYLMTRDDAAELLIQSPFIRQKLRIMCNAVRSAFDTTGWEDIRWERLL